MSSVEPPQPATLDTSPRKEEEPASGMDSQAAGQQQGAATESEPTPEMPQAEQRRSSSSQPQGPAAGSEADADHETSRDGETFASGSSAAPSAAAQSRRQRYPPRHSSLNARVSNSSPSPSHRGSSRASRGRLAADWAPRMGSETGLGEMETLQDFLSRYPAPGMGSYGLDMTGNRLDQDRQEESVSTDHPRSANPDDEETELQPGAVYHFPSQEARRSHRERGHAAGHHGSESARGHSRRSTIDNGASSLRQARHVTVTPSATQNNNNHNNNITSTTARILSHFEREAIPSSRSDPNQLDSALQLSSAWPSHSSQEHARHLPATGLQFSRSAPTQDVVPEAREGPLSFEPTPAMRPFISSGSSSFTGSTPMALDSRTTFSSTNTSFTQHGARPQQVRQSSGSVPRWQPDEDVNACPLCDRRFSFLFRRHHCRKCGLVVCDDCSRNYVDMPRDSIVRPPTFTPLSPGVELLERVRVCSACVPEAQYGPPPPYHLVPPSSSPPHATRPLATGRGESSDSSMAPQRPQASRTTPALPVPIPNRSPAPLRECASTHAPAPIPAPASVPVPAPAPAPASAPALPRPLREEDYCPVCGAVLPALDPYNTDDDTDRVAHIRDCLEGASGERRQGPGVRTAVIRYAATEADCAPQGTHTGAEVNGHSNGVANGNGHVAGPECEICFEEYKVGDALVRLVCLCRFHEECVQGWWVTQDRERGECPTHSQRGWEGR